MNGAQKKAQRNYVQRLPVYDLPAIDINTASSPCPPGEPSDRGGHRRLTKRKNRTFRPSTGAFYSNPYRPP
jgi:hypothetical protein